MKKAIFLVSLFIVVIAPFAVFAQSEMPIPGDVKILGISLSVLLTVIGAVIKNVVFKGDDKRKLTPWILMAVGAALSGAAGLTFFPDSPENFAGYIIFGITAGLGAVGLHSTGKNTLQFVKKKQE